MDPSGDVGQLSEKEECSREEVFLYLKSWKEALEALKEHYDKYFAGAVGGIVTLVVTIGLNYDKLEKLGWFERSLLASALVLLLLAAGNILNCTTFVLTARQDLLQLERQLILQDYDNLPRERISALDAQINSALMRAHQFFPYAYWCILLAVLLGVVGFFVILMRA